MSQELDKDVEIMYLVPSTDFYGKDQLKVRISSDFNRIPLPKEHEDAISEIWAERLAANPKLWNGTKFRIDSTEQFENGVTFNLGITDYRDFIGTNWSPKAKEYHELGRSKCGNSQVHMSDALGVGALVHTKDDFMILLRRSQHCGEAVGLLDIPGGHPEPKELVGKLASSEISLEDMSPADIVEEIFESTLREIVDEVNIPRECLSSPRLVGIARNTTSAGRPSSEYYCRCSLTSSEIRQRYLDGGHEEADESTNILFIPMATVLTLQQNKALWDDMAPSAKGCITLYQLNQARKAATI